MKLKLWLAKRLRQYADHIDYAGAPRAIGWSFTYEHGRGIVFREDRRGCPLWYLGHDDHERAHSEADTDHVILSPAPDGQMWVGFGR